MGGRIGIALILATLGSLGSAAAGEHGTKAEAQAMLDKVVAEMKANKTATLAKITQGVANVQSGFT